MNNIQEYIQPYQVANIYLTKRYKGACKYYIGTLGVGGGSEGNAYFAYVVGGGWGSRGKNAYIAYVRDKSNTSLNYLIY